MQTNDEAPFTDGELLDIIAGELGVEPGADFDVRLLGAVALLKERGKERTCVNVHEKRKVGDFFRFTCSECGASVHSDELGFCPVERETEEGRVVLPLSYCPSCGARVIGEGGCE